MSGNNLKKKSFKKKFCFAERPRGALISRNVATTNHPFEKDCNPQMTLKL